MIEKSQAYKDAIVGDARETHLKIIINLISPDLEYGAQTNSSILNYYDPELAYDRDIHAIPGDTTLELNRWVLDGSGNLLPDTVAPIRPNYAFCCFDFVDDIEQYWELAFTGVNVLQAFKVYFSDSYLDGIPSDLTVALLGNGYVLKAWDFTDNTATELSFDSFTVYNPTSIRITVRKTGLDCRRFRVTEVLLGIYEEWDEDKVGTLDIKQQVDFSASSLPYGTCNMGIDNSDRRFEPRNKNGLFASIEERQEVPIQIGVKLGNGTIDFTQVGSYYQSSGGWQTSNNGLLMNWEMVDIIGLLAQREYIVPNTLPTTLVGWVDSILSQLGNSFREKVIIDPNYSSKSMTVLNADAVTGQTCGDMIQYICQASGTFARADSTTGYLAIEPLWNSGNYLTLDNLVNYPTMKANDDVALITFTLSDETEVIVGGNNTAADKTLSIKNPFMHTSQQALDCARNILNMYGGNLIEILGRGDMSSECGDVDSIQLDRSVATSARRKIQEFNFTDGVMKNIVSSFIQPDGGFLYENSELITASGTWTAPTGVTEIRIVLGGGGSGGGNGANGSWSSAGANGADGLGGKIFVQTIEINSGQTFPITIGNGGSAGQSGGHTTFGVYTSEAGRVYDPAYTDAASGNTYGRTGTAVPLAGSGDGGKGGAGGRKGNRHTKKYTEVQEDGTVVTKTKTVVDNYPGNGATGTSGGSGFVLIYYDNPA